MNALSYIGLFGRQLMRCVARWMAGTLSSTCGFLFYCFISENITEYINVQEHRAGNTNFNSADFAA